MVSQVGYHGVSAETNPSSIHDVNLLVRIVIRRQCPWWSVV